MHWQELLNIIQAPLQGLSVVQESRAIDYYLPLDYEMKNNDNVMTIFSSLSYFCLVHNLDHFFSFKFSSSAFLGDQSSLG